MSYERIRTALIVAILLLAAAFGVRQAFAEASTLIDALIAVCLAASFPLLCRADARVTGRQVSRAFLGATVLFWPVLVPCYLVWSRGRRGVFVAFACGIVFLLAIAAPFFAANYVVNDTWDLPAWISDMWDPPEQADS